MLPLMEGDPRQVGPYRLHSRLGGGGMGQVYLGHSPGGRPVAVKLVRPELADDPDFRRRFAREVVNARKVGGFYTAQVVDADPNAPQPWLVTAYVPGPSLAEAIQRCGYLPEQTVKVLGAGLAEGLAAIHRCGIVHRDLKPGNVLLAADGPRVIDFGIAHALEASAPVTRGIGTPAFMSPEQVEGRAIGYASDVFSLGTVLAYAAAGTGPFGAGPHQAVTYRIVHQEPDFSRLPPGLVPLVAACLAKDPAYRPSLGSVLHQLAVPALGDHAGWLPLNVTDMIDDRQAAPPLRSADPRIPPPDPRAAPGAYAPPSPPGAYAAPSPPGAYAAPSPPGAYAAPSPPGAYAAPSPPGAHAAPSPLGVYAAPSPPGVYAAPSPPPPGAYSPAAAATPPPPRRRLPVTRALLASVVSGVAALAVAAVVAYTVAQHGGDSPSSAAAPSGSAGQVAVTGHLICSSHERVVGAWVAAGKFDSGFAYLRMDQNSSSSSYYYVLPAGERYSLNVGCGGSPGKWKTAATNAPELSGTDNSLQCGDIKGQTGYTSCTRWPAATPAPARPSGAVDVSGKLSCVPQGPVMGAWVAAQNGSDFAYTRWVGNGDVASYIMPLPSKESYTVHVGCGGTVEGWGTSIDKNTYVTGTENSFQCSTTTRRCVVWKP